MARKLATIPLNQLVMSKLLVNQAYENMGLRTTQMLGTVFDGIARHTPEGIAWRDMAMKEGFREAVRRRDAPVRRLRREEDVMTDTTIGHWRRCGRTGRCARTA